MRPAIVAALLGLACASARAAGTFGPRGEKPFGVLLLGEGGDREWKDSVEKLKKELGKKFPFEFVPGLADARMIQKGVERLEFQRVQKIVAVPLFVSSFSEVMDHNRFLFGIREKPAGPRYAHQRVSSRVPVVLAKALDDHPVLVEILSSRALALAKDPSRESLVLVGEVSGSTETARDWLASAQALAEKVRGRTGFSAAHAAGLRLGGSQKEREDSQKELRDLVRKSRRQGSVAVVPLEVTHAAVSGRIPKALEGAFVRFDGKAILPDPAVARWVSESAEAAARLPDMRVFKDGAGGRRTLESPPPVRTRRGGY